MERGRGVGRFIEFLLAPLVFLTMTVTITLTLVFFAIGWCAGALVAGWRSGRGRTVERQK